MKPREKRGPQPMIVTETTCTVSVESKIRKEITAEFQGILIIERFQ